jgi:hypothetical protein
MDNENFKPSDLYFCILPATLVGEKGEEDSVIVFVPIKYWEENKCLTDYFLADRMSNDIPEGYYWLPFHEETMWVTEKTPHQINEELTKLGYTESQEVWAFLTKIWESV